MSSTTTPPSSPVALREATKCLAPSRTGVLARLEDHKEEERLTLQKTSAALDARFMALRSLFPPRADVTSIATLMASQICTVPCVSWGCRSTVQDVSNTHGMDPSSLFCNDCLMQQLTGNRM